MLPLAVMWFFYFCEVEFTGTRQLIHIDAKKRNSINADENGLVLEMRDKLNRNDRSEEK